MTDLNPNPANSPRPELTPDSMDPNRFDKYGNAKAPLGPPPSTPGAGMALLGLALVVCVVGAMLFFFGGSSRDYTVKHETDIARSPAATTTVPTPAPVPVTPLNNPPQATPSEPQK
jgi:hypothetical protein